MIEGFLLGDGNVSISTSRSSSSLERRIDELVRLDNAGVDDREDDGGLISRECCRTTGINGTKALGDEWELTSDVVVVDDDGLE